MSLVDAFTPPDEELGYALYEDYLNVFDQHCYVSRIYGQGTFHLLFGQMPNIRKMKIKKTSSSYLDPRVHLCYLSPSGTGKGEGAKFAKIMAERIGLKWKEMDKVTDSGLVGTTRMNMDREFEIDYGWLHKSHGINILAATEGTTILKDNPPKESQEVMNFLQKTMNALGSSDAIVSKKTGLGDEISVEPVLSLFISTFPPTALNNIILERGLLQRMFLVVSTPTMDDRRKVSEIRDSRIAKPVDTTEMEKSIAKRLKHIDRHYHGIESIPFDVDAMNVLRGSSTRFYNKTNGKLPFLRAKLAEFITRFEDTQYKLALHFACLRKASEIGYEDAYHAKTYTQILFDDVLSYLERSIVVPKEYISKYNDMVQKTSMTITQMLMHCKVTGPDKKPKLKYAKSNGWVYKNHLIQNIAHIHKISDITAKQYVATLLDTQFLEYREHKNKTIVRVKKQDYDVN